MAAVRWFWLCCLGIVSLLVAAGCQGHAPLNRLLVSMQTGGMGSLQVHVQESKSAAYRVSYLSHPDWTQAEADLSAPSIATQTITVSAVVDPSTGTRSAKIYFPIVAPGNAYTLTVKALRPNASGTMDIVETGTQSNLAVSDASGTATTVTLSAQALATPQVAVPSSNAPAHTISLVGGSPFEGTMNGPLSQAAFLGPAGVALDTAGNAYVVDANVIRKIDTSGNVTAFAGNSWSPVNTLVSAAITTYKDGPAASALFYRPAGVAVDASGAVYVADSDNQCIRKITPAGVVSTLAGGNGTTTNGSGYQDGPGTTAKFSYPSGVAVDASGNVYVAERSNYCIRKITPAGVVSTLAGGNGTTTNGSGYKDGAGVSAKFFFPTGLSVDASGNVYVTDSSLIRKITPAGVVSTLAGGNGTTSNGSGYQDGPGTTAKFSGPAGPAVDANGNVYVADAYNQCIRKITPAGVVSTLAGGNGTIINGSGYKDGAGVSAMFSKQTSLAVDASGNVYVADGGNYCIRKITPAGAVSTVAGGNGTTINDAGYYLDGPAVSAKFNRPAGAAGDASGTVYVADSGNNCIRKIIPAGVVSTLAGGNGTTTNGSGYQDGPGTSAKFAAPNGIAVDAGGTVYVAERSNVCIRKITPSGVVSTLAGGNGTSTNGSGYLDGPGTSAKFLSPCSLTIDASGTVYVADSRVIRKVTPAGVVSTLAGGNGTTANAAGYQDGPGTSARFAGLGGIAVDASGNVYVVDNSVIRKVTPAGVVSTLAGGNGTTANGPGYQDGAGTAAKFSFPEGVAVDARGNVYVTDTNNQCIRMITPTGTVSTCVAGPNQLTFSSPSGITAQASGGLYVTDMTYNTVYYIR